MSTKIKTKYTYLNIGSKIKQTKNTLLYTIIITFYKKNKQTTKQKQNAFWCNKYK